MNGNDFLENLKKAAEEVARKRMFRKTFEFEAKLKEQGFDEEEIIKIFGTIAEVFKA